jgi:hypothetical protein
MKTKFHHYIFPTVPPAALLVGIFLDRLMGSQAPAKAVEGEDVQEVASDEDGSSFSWRPAAGALLCILAPLGWVAGVAGLWGNLRGIIPEDVPAEQISDWVLNHGPSPLLAWLSIALGLAALIAADRLIPKPLEALNSRRPSHQSAALGAMLVFAAVIVAFVGRDLSWVTDGRPQGYERLVHLFVYNYGRLWPEQFDFRPMFTGFAIVAGTIIALAALQRLRHLMARAMVGLALLFATWTLNVYMIDLSPHWGMRTVIHRYYELRPNEDVPLISWQMNWKGENFYSGNGTYVFVNLDNQSVRDWMEENDGSHAFFVTEYSRLGGLRSLLSGREITEVTTQRECNKFIMIEVREL